MFFNWRFLRSNTLEQLELKLENKLGLRNMQEKLENIETACCSGEKLDMNFSATIFIAFDNENSFNARKLYLFKLC